MNAPLLVAEAVSLTYGKEGSAGNVRDATNAGKSNNTGSAGNAGARAVLGDVSLGIGAGEIVSVIGPSGAGKSSVLRVLAGLQRPTRGTVRMHGAVLDGPHPRVAVAFQDACLLPWLSVAHNVGFGLDFHHQPATTRAERQARVARMLDAVGLAHAGALFPAQLSGGMAQRVALARCMARQPEALLLDEPFGALDEVTRADMQALLLGIVRTYRPATLLITHDIDEALLLSDRIVLLGAPPGAPATVVREWRITLPHPREAEVEALGALRVEIVRELRQLVRQAGTAHPYPAAPYVPHAPGVPHAAGTPDASDASGPSGTSRVPPLRHANPTTHTR